MIVHARRDRSAAVSVLCGENRDRSSLSRRTMKPDLLSSNLIVVFERIDKGSCNLYRQRGIVAGPTKGSSPAAVAHGTTCEGMSGMITGKIAHFSTAGGGRVSARRRSIMSMHGGLRAIP